MSRLPPPFGVLIDRSKPIRFTFEGEGIDAFAGDTIASAVAARGQLLLSRSFKYHRPRGAFTMAGHDGNTLVDVDGAPMVRADVELARDGMRITGEHYRGSLKFDRGRWIEAFSRFMPVGFYYRAFFCPHGAWRFWEPVVRRMAGLGRVREDAAHPYRDKQYLFADVAVIGAGPAGLAAAIEAADGGAEVLLVDRLPRLGGSLLWRGDTAEADRLAAEVARRAKIRVLTSASAFGLYADRWLAITQGRRFYKVRAGRAIVATGAIEQPAVFRNNDALGVMTTGAALRLVHLYGVKPGARAVLVGEGAAAPALRAAGIEVAATVDLMQRFPYEARVSGGRVTSLTVAGRDGQKAEEIACDLVCVSAGLMPAAQLACHAGARLVYDATLNGHRVVDLPDGVIVAGDAAGVTVPNPACPIVKHPRGKDFVDFDEDLTVADIENAVADGFGHIELTKRYSTVGMGPSQGRTSALAAMRIVARATGRPEAEIGATTTRPPAAPVSMAALAGRGFEPERRTAMHAWHLARGARMMPAGVWLRPAYYGDKAARTAAIEAEVKAIRTDVGLIDVSTLGKLEIRGPDAAEFLERIYVGAYARQAIGRTRYALLCDDSGAVLDDGVVARQGERHFYVTATTGAADQVYRQMLWWNAQWRLDVDIANVTAAYAAISIAGPRSREVLASLAPGMDLSKEAFPYLAVREGVANGSRCRLLRVGFVGELGWEIHLPASEAASLWEALAAKGARPVGVEAQRVLRLEKGHVIVGQDTDGLTHPLEAAMGWAVQRKKRYFVGGRSIRILEAQPQTRRLVGFTLPDPRSALPEECHLVVRGGEIVGRVTSVAWSPSLNRAIGLAYVAPDQAEVGTRFQIKVWSDRAGGQRLTEAEVAATPFYDPGNARQEL